MQKHSWACSMRTAVHWLCCCHCLQRALEALCTFSVGSIAYWATCNTQSSNTTTYYNILRNANGLAKQNCNTWICYGVLGTSITAHSVVSHSHYKQFPCLQIHILSNSLVWKFTFWAILLSANSHFEQFPCCKFTFWAILLSASSRFEQFPCQQTVPVSSRHTLQGKAMQCNQPHRAQSLRYNSTKKVGAITNTHKQTIIARIAN